MPYLRRGEIVERGACGESVFIRLFENQIPERAAREATAGTGG